jgi:unsaturated rhamnogalacturonyl hydrolase
MWSQKMADSVIKRTPRLSNRDQSPYCDHAAYSDKWSYDYGVVLKGVESVWRKTGDQKYFDYIYRNMDHFIKKDGSIIGYTFDAFNIDYINNGKVLLMLYQETGEKRFKKAVDLLRDQLRHHPQTSEGVFWHKKVYPHQVWLDGLYMGAPFYAAYVKEFGLDVEFNHIVRQYIYCVKNAKDPKTGLLYHAFDEKRVQPWCDPITGLSKNFWGRSMGWFVMGLVDTISFLPPDHVDFNTLKELLETTLLALKKVQDETGVWYQVLDQAQTPGNYLEASASCMNLYAMAKGIRLGLLDLNWLETAKKAYQGIIQQFILVTEAGLINLNKTCQVAGLGGPDKRDGSYTYYISEPIIVNDQKGIGAFILAMAEMEMLVDEKGVSI